nr:uncharacterized protein LOC127487382 [Oryctolagus cuniculus]XP_051700880.1 uncharacterized protein LOC127490918 [Oryctolagus cuniculus]
MGLLPSTSPDGRVDAGGVSVTDFLHSLFDLVLIGLGINEHRPAGPVDANGNQLLWYWPFAISDLYNWQMQNAPFSKNPQELINLLETVLFTHQPTWDDCNKLLSILFTMEERNRILEAARKAVPGLTRAPLTDLVTINAYLPATRPDWDYNTAQDSDWGIGFWFGDIITRLLSLDGRPLRRPHDNSHSSQNRRGRCMDPLLSRPTDRPGHSSYNGALRRNLEHPQTSIQPTETQIAQRWGPIPKPFQLALILLLLLFFFSFHQASAVSNLHQPYQWVLNRHGKVLQSGTGTLGGQQWCPL